MTKKAPSFGGVLPGAQARACVYVCVCVSKRVRSKNLNTDQSRPDLGCSDIKTGEGDGWQASNLITCTRNLLS